MSETTDPARELADLCQKLAPPHKQTGDAHLADIFQVAPWSAEFFRIIFSIVSRCDELSAIVDALEMDEDHKVEAKKHIEKLKLAFSRESLLNPWHAKGATLLSPENVQPIKMLSPTVRGKVSYPRVTDENVETVLKDVIKLKDWLQQHQVKEQDFIRQAILDGLVQFQFRLERFRWLGWGYTLEALREVISAYMALERGMPDDNSAPDAEAVLKKTMALLESINKKISWVKGVSGNADFILAAYGAARLTWDGVSVAGLLGSG